MTEDLYEKRGYIKDERFRRLYFGVPYKLTRSFINNEYINNPAGNYERGATIYTKHGICHVASMKWKTNLGMDMFTIFKTVIDGMVYMAIIEEPWMSDRWTRYLTTYCMRKFKTETIKK